MASDRNEPTVSETTFAPFKAVWRLGLAIVVMWFTHMAIHAVWVRYNALEAGEHIRAQLDYYIPQSDPTGLAATMAEESTALLKRSGLLVLIPAQPKNPSTEDMRLGQGLQRGLWAAFRPEIVAAIYSTVLYAAKLGIVISLIPLLLLWLVAFGVDGLVQRYIRRVSAGRESATIYHRAKLYGVKLLPPLAAVVFLCSPVAMHPAWVFLPAALLSAILLRVQATYYKKYL
jgi:integrating conjugative element membrane protein (TIGR03747 family)